MKSKIYLIIAAFLIFGSCKRVDEKDSDFNNAIYIENAKIRNSVNIMLKTRDINFSREINAGMALPENKDITVQYKIDFSLVSAYGKANYIDCKPLPEELCSLSEKQAIFKAGSVISSGIKVDFKDLDKLEKNINYVLPVTIENVSGNKVLHSAKTLYYVLKKGATITTAAYMGNNYIELPEMATNTSVKGLTKITMEALIKPNIWKNISSIMGIEEYFLIRIGDTFPEDQIQVAYGGNVGGPKLGAPGKWTHVAVTFDRSSREIIFYVNGKESLKDYCNFAPDVIDLTKSKTGSSNNNLFYIGHSYDNSRYFDGYMCEVRIWNTVRTQEEIEKNIYEVDPYSEGLIAYWKMDEGEGNSIKDYSKGGNNGKSKNNLKWIEVELPE